MLRQLLPCLHRAEPSLDRQANERASSSSSLFAVASSCISSSQAATSSRRWERVSDDAGAYATCRMAKRAPRSVACSSRSGQPFGGALSYRLAAGIILMLWCVLGTMQYKSGWLAVELDAASSLAPGVTGRQLATRGRRLEAAVAAAAAMLAVEHPVTLQQAGPIPAEPQQALTDKGHTGEGYLAICAAIKDQHLDVREWVAYHHMIGESWGSGRMLVGFWAAVPLMRTDCAGPSPGQHTQWNTTAAKEAAPEMAPYCAGPTAAGVQRFYIVDPGSSPPLRDALADFIASGLVAYTWQVHHPGCGCAESCGGSRPRPRPSGAAPSPPHPTPPHPPIHPSTDSTPILCSCLRASRPREGPGGHRLPSMTGASGSTGQSERGRTGGAAAAHGSAPAAALGGYIETLSAQLSARGRCRNRKQCSATRANLSTFYRCACLPAHLFVLTTSWRPASRRAPSCLTAAPPPHPTPPTHITTTTARHEWMAFIDADEFLLLRDASPSLPILLAGYEDAGGLAVNWRVFGSSGREVRGGAVRRTGRQGALSTEEKCCGAGRGQQSWRRNDYLLGGGRGAAACAHREGIPGLPAQACWRSPPYLSPPPREQSRPRVNTLLAYTACLPPGHPDNAHVKWAGTCARGGGRAGAAARPGVAVTCPLRLPRP